MFIVIVWSGRWTLLDKNEYTLPEAMEISNRTPLSKVIHTSSYDIMNSLDTPFRELTHEEVLKALCVD